MASRLALAPLCVRLTVRRLLILSSRNGTLAASARSLLVIAPHPDDETLGCGARIALARAGGSQVTVFVATRGELSGPRTRPDRAMAERRGEELHQALQELGVEPSGIRQGAYPDGALLSHVDELALDIEALVRELRPDDVCVTHIDEPHQDHAAAARATRLALGRLERPPRLLEYPIWLWATWPLSRTHGVGTVLSAMALAWRPRGLERIQVRSVLRLKTAALSRYGSQLGSEALPGPVLRRALHDPELYFVVVHGTT